MYCSEDTFAVEPNVLNMLIDAIFADVYLKKIKTVLRVIFFSTSNFYVSKINILFCDMYVQKQSKSEYNPSPIYHFNSQAT